MTVVNIWINCPNAEVAAQIAETLVEERLVACTNTFPKIRSAYHWLGKVERESEIPLLVKTRNDLFDKVCARVRKLHPYEVPGIIGIEATSVNPEYEQWVFEETKAGG